MPAPAETMGLSALERLVTRYVLKLSAAELQYGTTNQVRFRELERPLDRADRHHLGFLVQVSESTPLENRAKRGRQALRSTVAITYLYQVQPMGQREDLYRCKDVAQTIARALLDRADPDLYEQLQSVRLQRLGPWDILEPGWMVGQVTLLVDHDIDITNPAVGE